MSYGLTMTGTLRHIVAAPSRAYCGRSLADTSAHDPKLRMASVCESCQLIYDHWHKAPSVAAP